MVQTFDYRKYLRMLFIEKIISWILALWESFFTLKQILFWIREFFFPWKFFQKSPNAKVFVKILTLFDTRKFLPAIFLPFKYICLQTLGSLLVSSKLQRPLVKIDACLLESFSMSVKGYQNINIKKNSITKENEISNKIIIIIYLKKLLIDRWFGKC